MPRHRLTRTPAGAFAATAVAVPHVAKESAMRYLRHTVLVAVAVAMCAAPVAAADKPHDNSGAAAVAAARGGGLTGGELLGEDWARGLARPSSPDPFSGGCRPLVGNVLTPAWVNGTATCTVTRSSLLFVFFGSFCSDLDDPPLFKTEDQLACAVAADQAIRAFSVTVDRRTINIHTRRFELFSPQRTARLTAENFFGVPAGTPVTFTAHAWGAVVGKLHPGQHTVTVEVVAPDWGLDPLTRTINLTVVRGESSDEDDN